MFCAGPHKVTERIDFYFIFLRIVFRIAVVAVVCAVALQQDGCALHTGFGKTFICQDRNILTFTLKNGVAYTQKVSFSQSKSDSLDSSRCQKLSAAVSGLLGGSSACPALQWMVSHGRQTHPASSVSTGGV